MRPHYGRYPYKWPKYSSRVNSKVESRKQLQSIIHSKHSVTDDTIRVVDAKKIALTNDHIVSWIQIQVFQHTEGSGWPITAVLHLVNWNGLMIYSETSRAGITTSFRHERDVNFNNSTQINILFYMFSSWYHIRSQKRNRYGFHIMVTGF